MLFFGSFHTFSNNGVAKGSGLRHVAGAQKNVAGMDNNAGYLS